MSSADKAWDEESGDEEFVADVKVSAALPVVAANGVLDDSLIVSAAAAADDEDDDESDADSIAALSTAETEAEEDIDAEEITLDLDTTTGEQAYLKYVSHYEDVTPEFADVEIFLVSVDSLLIELTAHTYNNWTLGGQTLVLTAQIDRFLSLLADRGGRFKLVWFSDFAPLYAQDPVLDFLRAVVAQHLLQSQWSDEIETFLSAIDPKWSDLLTGLTPSFLLLSPDDPCAQFSISPGAFKQRFVSLALDVLQKNIPVVEFVGLALNICNVNASRVAPRSINFVNWTQYLLKTWSIEPKTEPQRVGAVADVSSASSVAEFWATLIKANYGNDQMPAERFDCLSSAVLLAALVIENRGASRSYMEEDATKEAKIDVIRGRRLLLTAATRAMDSSSKKLNFKVADCWDGRLVTSIFDALSSNKEVLPFRLQEQFAKLHDFIGLKHSPAMDASEKLLDPFMTEKTALIDTVELAHIDLPLLTAFAPDLANVFFSKGKFGKSYSGEVDAFVQRYSWRPERVIAEDYNKTADKVPDKPLDAYQQRREERRRRRNQQIMSRWYEFFAQSLEGRGSSLLVDFARVPRGMAVSTTIEEESMGGDEDDGKKKKPAKQQHTGKGAASKKAPVISKKDAILANIKTDKNKKRVDGELQMIRFATQQKNSISLLENLMAKLELSDSKALCAYEQATRLMRELADVVGTVGLDQRRVEGIKLIEKIKELFVQHWAWLDERQKDRVTEMWVQLGFEKAAKKKYAEDRKMSMEMNMIDYQLAVAGELIDIQSDPVKDDRVTGFNPDAWQRQMLDVVDRNSSALIIAPTSAGKTFVSYYCIEKVLRQSDEDIVIYVSPTKALVNQVAGSIYARFRNKTLSGGKTLFGVYTRDFSENVMNSQVLITVPECLDILLMSANPTAQEWCSRIKYVIFDEVHCIGSQSNVDTSAVVWEHVLLMIPCPFLALSATIGNPGALHAWLQAAETSKKTHRIVQLIKYDERYSELELAIQKFDEHAESKGITKLNPFGVYVPEKLKIFGIPADQQLTARQIYDLYHAMAEKDEATKKELEPLKFFNLNVDAGEKVWLARSDLRRYEMALKTRFLEWLETDRDKMVAVLNKLGVDVRDELEFRAKPFEQRPTALQHIVPLIEHLRDRQMLPCIGFNEDRRICERLAQQLLDEFARRQREFEESPEFKQNFLIKDEAKILKQQKRQRDVATKKKGDKDEEAQHDREEENDPLAALKMRTREALAKFRLSGRGKDPELYRKVIERLTKKDGSKESTKILLQLLDRGIGYHHAGMANVQRQSVEILYRSGHLAVVFSTSTLALGINMPCKTVIFGIDSHELTPLLFRQMSGRAGRRGFDHSGTVVFMSLPTSKIRRLLTASLSHLRGNVPFTTSFVLRLLTLVTHFNDVTDLPKAIKRLPETTQKAALTLLRNSFVKFTSTNRAEALDRQSQMLFGFSLQLLRRLGLLSEKGAPIGLANIVSHLHSHEPGNLVFVYLLQKGAFHRLCEQLSGRRLKEMIVRVMAHLFTHTIIPRNWTPETKGQEFHSSKVFLEPLPAEFATLVTEYNAELTTLFKTFMQQMNDNKSLQGETFALTGRSDADVDFLSGDIIKPLDEKITFDETLLPTFAYPPKDHRGRPILLNAFVCDFYDHELRRAITSENGIGESEIWNLLNDFQLTLSEIATALKLIGRSTDKVVNAMDELSTEYSEKFRRAFGMKQRNF